MMKISKTMMAVSLGLAVLAGVVRLATPDDREPEPMPRPAPEATSPRAIATDAAATKRAMRIFQIASTNPSLRYGEIEALVEQSDRMRQHFEEEEEEGDDLGSAVRERLSEVEVDEAEALEWFERHRDRFGSRSFEQSRHTVERLIAIEQVREEFALL